MARTKKTRLQKDRTNTLRHLRNPDALRWAEIDAQNNRHEITRKHAQRQARVKVGAWALSLFDKLGA